MTRTLRVLRRAETDQADTLYGEEARVIEEAERLLGSGLAVEEPGTNTQSCCTNLKISTKTTNACSG